MMRFTKHGIAILAAAMLLSCPVHAQNLVSIDASAVASSPQPVAAVLGSSRTPSGDVLAANSQYLTLNGKPWLPVMGEFHFSRYPEAEWEQEILKMKAAGVNVVSTYIIWIHHEQVEGVFEWSGQRNLREFTQLCAKHQMYVYPRIGPWAHAEVRNGGLPDWVLKNSPVRQDDPTYLREVQSFFSQIAVQLHGLLWKDGGPVIGIQIENEYRTSGSGKGDEHIRTLKKMAIDDGLDVPLYTVTGWDGAAVPLDAVLPVFGGYPDAPWESSSSRLPPNEVYAFRFGNRVASSMGAIGGNGQSGATIYRGTPFFTAEVGDGIQDTYFRRPVLNADDIAAMVPVMLGSGVNLLGYYMFHGGRNPEGGAITLQESQRTGYPTDVPVKSYDFQAPLGEFGQQRESLRKLKLIHYFLNDFGGSLAPMAPHAPSVVPADPSDASVPRVAARTFGDSGFVFFNNYVRGLQMPARSGFQVELKLPAAAVRVPAAPITLPAGVYGIWPVNLSLGDIHLHYATAQLFKRVVSESRTYYFFFTIPGVQPEFTFDHSMRPVGIPSTVEQQLTADALVLRPRAGVETVLHLNRDVSVVVMPQAEAEQVWKLDDPALLLRTSAEVFSDGPHWTLLSTGDSHFRFGIFGTHSTPLPENVHVHPMPSTGIFSEYRVDLPAIHPVVKVVSIRPAAPRAPWQMGPSVAWRPKSIPLAPEDAEFATAAEWRLEVADLHATRAVSDVFLRINYQGDVARLSGHGLLDDNFWNGQPWAVGLREIGQAWRSKQTFRLSILPLPQSYPMYLENAASFRFRQGRALALESVQIIPQYRFVLTASARN
ncbi:MAG TPA: beta-galactosidase [Acidobacteriaceae bacterium]